MNFSTGEARALAFVSDLHPDEQLVATIALEGGIGWLTVSVHSGTGNQRRQLHYIVSPHGRVWNSGNGSPSGRVEPPVREADLDLAVSKPVDEPGHVQQLIDHLACLDDAQVEQVRTQLNAWRKAARVREAKEKE